ncbi:hypothetical protein CF326_g7347 [Tilletia indica]|nr:hypothetical protein CF326_g7347 [Tilletia indica]
MASCMLRGAFESHLVRFNPLAKQREYKDVFSIWSLDVARVAIVRNTTLAQHSARTKLDDFFSVSTGPRGAKYLPAPPYYRKESMATKALADLAESAMGASLMTGGVHGALHVARCLRITPRPIQSLGETAEIFHLRIAQAMDNADVPALRRTETLIGYKFRVQSIAIPVVTSKAIKQPELLSRKFVGNAAFHFVLCTEIFREHPKLDQGKLNQLKDLLCMHTTLAALVESSGLHVLSSLTRSPALKTPVTPHGCSGYVGWKSDKEQRRKGISTGRGYRFQGRFLI